MATTAAAVTRGHVPSHQQQYNVPVRPATVQVWQVYRHNYSPDGVQAHVQHGLEGMRQETFYQYPTALDSGEFRSRDGMLAALFAASAFGDRGVKFAYWYEHGTVSTPLPTTYDQLHQWISAGDFSQAFYINDDALETPEKLDEEAAAEARIDDLLNSANRGAHCDYCGDWCAYGEYDEDWMGTGLNVCYAGEHEAEKAETEAYLAGMMGPASPRDEPKYQPRGIWGSSSEHGEGRRLDVRLQPQHEMRCIRRVSGGLSFPAACHACAAAQPSHR